MCGSRRGKIITIGIFLVFLYSFFVFEMVKKDEAYSELENRSLEKKPEFSIGSFISGEYSSDYESYVKDQFPLRDKFVAAKNYMELALGKTELNGVFLGKDDYLIENHKQADYEGERAVKNAEAIASAGNRWKKMLGENRVSVMIVPTSQTIMTDKLPLFASAYDQREYIATIEAGLEDGVFVDVSQVLKEHSDEYIYYKTDHHWTTYGAYLAYEKWCSERGLSGYSLNELKVSTVTEDFFGTIHSKLNIKASPDSIDIYEPKDYNVKAVYNMGEVSDTVFDMSYLSVKDKYSMFFGGNQGIVEITDSSRDTVSDKRPDKDMALDDSERVLLMVKDSYANCFAPMTFGMYDRVYVVDLRYFNMKIDTFIEMYGVTDVLLLYNADTLTDDVYVARIK